MIKTDVQIISGKSKKGEDFKALKFIVKTPLGNYESGLNFPTPMELSIIERYINNDTVREGIEAVYSNNGEISPDKGF